MSDNLPELDPATAKKLAAADRKGKNMRLGWQRRRLACAAAGIPVRASNSPRVATAKHLPENDGLLIRGLLRLPGIAARVRDDLEGLAAALVSWKKLTVKQREKLLQICAFVKRTPVSVVEAEKSRKVP